MCWSENEGSHQLVTVFVMQRSGFHPHFSNNHNASRLPPDCRLSAPTSLPVTSSLSRWSQKTGVTLTWWKCPRRKQSVTCGGTWTNTGEDTSQCTDRTAAFTITWPSLLFVCRCTTEGAACPVMTSSAHTHSATMMMTVRRSSRVESWQTPLYCCDRGSPILHWPTSTKMLKIKELLLSCYISAVHSRAEREQK